MAGIWSRGGRLRIPCCYQGQSLWSCSISGGLSESVTPRKLNMLNTFDVRNAVEPYEALVQIPCELEDLEAARQRFIPNAIPLVMYDFRRSFRVSNTKEVEYSQYLRVFPSQTSEARLCSNPMRAGRSRSRKTKMHPKGNPSGHV